MKQLNDLAQLASTYRAEVLRYRDALTALSYPRDAHHESTISADNYISWLVSKHYLEDLHSTTLAYLLSFTSPEDGKSRPFLAYFLELLEELLPEGVELGTTAEKLDVQQEAHSDGFVDLLLTEQHAPRGKPVALIIENKIRAGDQQRQLPRYFAAMSTTHHVPTTVYLTMDGHEPSRDDWTAEDWKTPVVTVPYVHTQRPSILSHVLEPAMSDPHCRSVQSLVTWYMEILQDLQGRQRVIGMLRDFSRELIGNRDAMTAISDILNNQGAIEEALCQELGARVSAALRSRELDWSIVESTDYGGRDIAIPFSNRVGYHLWFEENVVSHGFVSDGRPFGNQKAKQFDSILGEGGDSLFDDTVYYVELLRIDLADGELSLRFSEEGVKELADRAEATLSEYSKLYTNQASGRR